MIFLFNKVIKEISDAIYLSSAATKQPNMDKNLVHFNVSTKKKSEFSDILLLFQMYANTLKYENSLKSKLNYMEKDSKILTIIAIPAKKFMEAYKVRTASKVVPLCDQDFLYQIVTANNDAFFNTQLNLIDVTIQFRQIRKGFKRTTGSSQ